MSKLVMEGSADWKHAGAIKINQLVGAKFIVFHLYTV
jgi:hypothetical protein